MVAVFGRPVGGIAGQPFHGGGLVTGDPQVLAVGAHRGEVGVRCVGDRGGSETQPDSAFDVHVSFLAVPPHLVTSANHSIQ